MSGIIDQIAKRPNTNKYEFTVDNVDDIQYLPTINNGKLIKGTAEWCDCYAPFGSTCFVISNSSLYILGSTGWKEV